MIWIIVIALTVVFGWFTLVVVHRGSKGSAINRSEDIFYGKSYAIYIDAAAPTQKANVLLAWPQMGLEIPWPDGMTAQEAMDAWIFHPSETHYKRTHQ